MFKDRKDAGEKIARALKEYQGSNALVLGIPRGGALVGYYAAEILNLEFNLIVVRKLPYPENPEAGFGALAEDGSLYLNERAIHWVEEKTVKKVIREQQEETNRRVKALRRGIPFPDVKGRTVILVDDGIAMGSTMRAAVLMCENLRAEKIVVAAPVSGEETKGAFKEIADEVVIIETPRHFHAVAQAYEHWYDVPDEEVVEMMEKNKWRRSDSN